MVCQSSAHKRSIKASERIDAIWHGLFIGPLIIVMSKREPDVNQPGATLDGFYI
jgi:hypothetical protein